MTKTPSDCAPGDTASILPLVDQALALAPSCRAGAARDRAQWTSIVDRIVPQLPDGVARATLERARTALSAAAVDDAMAGEFIERAVATLMRLQKDRAVSLPSEAPAPELAPADTDRDAETVELLGDFLQEAEEGLEQAEAVLMEVEQSGSDMERVNLLFRVFHTIKGVAGCLEISDVTSLGHITETLLDEAREGTLELSGEPLQLVFEAATGMRRLLGGVRQAVEQNAPITPDPSILPTVRKIESALNKKRPAPSSETPPRELARVADRELGATGTNEVTAGQPAGGPKLRETLKVDLERVDSVVEMIGELIIVESMVVNAPEILSLSSVKLRNYLGQLTKISRDLQNIAMRMRMVPVRGVFQKMARMVRELAHKTGKAVVLTHTGEGAEMDRSMIERVEDPLIHMIRNAVDHAIEPAAERAAASKSAVGSIRLSAYHEGGSIVIEIADDGRGLQREAILNKAIARGLVREGDNLSDADVFNLIFLPGFSTASKVTEISGRGVGMDVVKRNVEAMRGRVIVLSEPGRGSRFKMVLPLTLAIIDGMLVVCGNERYIIPSLSIVESLQPTATMIRTMADRGELIAVRDEILPLVRLDQIFGVPKEQRTGTSGRVVVVESLGRKVALWVDDVITQQQVVIKPLGTGLGNSDYLSGAAILSDGRVGLILNVDQLGALTTTNKHQRPWSTVKEASL